MSWQVTQQTIDLGDGREISLETGKLARQADGAVLVKMGKAALLATVVSNTKMRDGAEFFPLSVDYQEKFASAGRIPGGFARREGRLSSYEILISRLVDRALRPLFPDGYFFDTQVILSLVSYDPEVAPDALAGLAASAALTISDIPFNGPISEVRVARVEGAYVVNPTPAQLAIADLEIMLGASMDNVMMVEGEAQECSEEELVEAIKVGHEAIKVHCQAQLDFAKAAGAPENRAFELEGEEDEALEQRVYEFAKDKVYAVAKGALDKKERKEALSAIKKELVSLLEGEEAEEEKIELAKTYLKKAEKKVIRSVVLDEQIRLDGRQLTEVRPLNIEVDFLASPHGSSLFCRGETQSLTTVTLGSKQDEQMIDKAAGLEYDKFLLHYNFPPFCTGEAKPLRGTSRREIGHGTLAKRSLAQVMPAVEDNPYTIRVVSDVLESNGSSSMATVCAGSLALMDAGVQIKGGVSGIAMGMITDENGRVAVLSDILGDEDHLGDMDFKVTGTAEGICAVQMDIKVDGLPYEVLIQALHQAKEGRLHILEQMNEVISEPRVEPKPHAPRIDILHVAKEFIGAIIGPGGKVIQEMQRETGSSIHIEELPDGRGQVTIYSADKGGLMEAKRKIELITTVPEIGEVYDSVVKSIMPYGAFVEILPGKEGLLHISEITWERLESLDGVLAEGDEIQVKLIGKDDRSGKLKLSRKVLTPMPEGYQPRERSDRGGDRRGGDRRGGDRRGGGGDRRGGDRRGGYNRRR